MRMLNQLVHFSTVPLFFLDLAISSHCFSNSGSSSVSIMAWNVSLNAQALWRMARPELIYNIDIQQYTICTCTSLNNTIPKQKTFAYKIINKMSQFVLHGNWCVYRWGAYTCTYREKKRVCSLVVSLFGLYSRALLQIRSTSSRNSLPVWYWCMSILDIIVDRSMGLEITS